MKLGTTGEVEALGSEVFVALYFIGALLVQHRVLTFVLADFNPLRGFVRGVLFPRTTWYAEHQRRLTGAGV